MTMGISWRNAGCRVMQGDTAVILAERVLVREHSFLVETLKRIIDGEIALPVRKDS